MILYCINNGLIQCYFCIIKDNTLKFSKKIKCEDCKLNCDIYQALTHSNSVLKSIDTLHVFYNRHEMICKQGSNVNYAIYLVYGTAKLFIEGINNKNIILYMMQPHNYIGLLSFFESPKYMYSVMALEESQGCMIDLNIVKKLYIENHELLINLNSAFGKSVQLIMNKLISLSQKQIRGRISENILYLSELYQSHKFKMHLTRKELGELSGISEENSVRILSKLKNENIININGREIEILDFDLLKKICECG